MLVEHPRRQPAGVGPHTSCRPEHCVGECWRLSGAPLDTPAGDLIACKAVGYRRAVSRMQRHPCLTESTPNTFPRPRMMVDQGPLPGEVEIDLLVRPGPRDIGGTAHRSGTTTDDDHRLSGGQTIVCGAKIGADVVGRLQARLTPEA